MVKYLGWLVKSFIFVVWALLVYAIISDFITDNKWRIIFWSIFLLISLLSFFVFKHLSLRSNFLLNFVILLDIFGEIIFEIFYHFLYYDKILHFLVPVILVSIFYDFLSNKIDNKKKRLYYAASITFSLGLFWEIAEVAFAALFDAPMVGVFIHAPGAKHFFNFGISVMGPIEDILWDIFLDLTGVLMTFLVGLRIISKK